ncbi:unnamed protein product, partial [Polarella glacialis]
VLWALAQGGLDEGFEGAVSSSAERPKQKYLSCWSCGCSSGEEAYYLRMIWQKRLAPVFPELDLQVLGTDLSLETVEAAIEGSYPLHSVKALPDSWRRDFFEAPRNWDPDSIQGGLPGTPSAAKGKHRLQKLVQQNRRGYATGTPTSGLQQQNPVSEDLWRLVHPDVRRNVSFLPQDVLEEMPDGPFDLIMSRYAVCLYIAAEKKTQVLAAMVERLRPGGFLVIGEKDKL